MMIRKILIGMDESKYAEHAAKYGFDLARSLKADVGIVNIVEPMAVPMVSNGADEILGTPLQGIPSMNYTDILEAQTKGSRSMLESAVKKFGKDLQVTSFNEYGSTGEGIISCATHFHADIIVIGTHARSGFDRFLSGDIAEYVVRHSEIPVLVVPGKE
jgi:nucleotide-binding universal stress UspA family protein